MRTIYIYIYIYFKEKNSIDNLKSLQTHRCTTLLTKKTTHQPFFNTILVYLFSQKKKIKKNKKKIKKGNKLIIIHSGTKYEKFISLEL